MPQEAPRRVLPNVQRRDGGRNNRGDGNNANNNQNPPAGGNPMPSPWLDPQNNPTPNATASFVEYLRWMREPNHPQRDGTKIEILDKLQSRANYKSRLTQLTKRTKLMAGNTFLVKCSWRIRVGGHRGPESILLPAFDALGMPYIPSSTLRGIARAQAIREIQTEKNLSWKNAEKLTAPYFGDIEATNKAYLQGKVIFFDAYPVPSEQDVAGGLSMDMANNIWSWQGNQLIYNPNPNLFLSLKEPVFCIGLRLASNCQDLSVLEKVKTWLVAGLQSGVGSQVNSGYGELLTAGALPNNDEFLKVQFSLNGQLIHGAQRFTQWSQNRQGAWQMRGRPEAEVRTVAFKSMLRYWFRAFSLGVLTVEQTKKWEAKLFGAIDPQSRGWVKFEVVNGKITQVEPRANNQGKNDDCGEQEGTLILSYSPAVAVNQKDSVQTLFKSLAWMMFHLGGIGQGARRPCYSRKNRQYAPWWRGSTFYIENKEPYWQLPRNVNEFRDRFRQKLKEFYNSLATVTTLNVNPNNLNALGQVEQRKWTEAIDRNCRIIVCAGAADHGKPFSLARLHHNGNYDPNLCGSVQGGVKPSPVWISDLDEYQVVTVFGATVNPRRNYLQVLQDNASQYAQIFPFN